jgi:hypothetical protein
MSAGAGLRSSQKAARTSNAVKTNFSGFTILSTPGHILIRYMNIYR